MLVLWSNLRRRSYSVNAACFSRIVDLSFECKVCCLWMDKEVLMLFGEDLVVF